MLLSLCLAFALQEPGAANAAPPDPSPELALAQKENRTLLVIAQSADEAHKAGVQKLLKDSSIRRELQYEFVIAYRPGPARPGDTAKTSFTFWNNSGKANTNFTYADLLMDNGEPNAQKFLTLLKQNESTPWDALKVLESARLTAVKENKRLLIHLGAPW